MSGLRQCTATVEGFIAILDGDNEGDVTNNRGEDAEGRNGGCAARGDKPLPKLLSTLLKNLGDGVPAG